MDDVFGTMDKPMPQDLYQAIRTSAVYNRFMREQHCKGHLSDEFMLSEGVPPDEEKSDCPALKPSGVTSVHLMRSHTRNHIAKQLAQQRMLAANHHKQESSKAQVQVLIVCLMPGAWCAKSGASLTGDCTCIRRPRQPISCAMRRLCRMCCRTLARNVLA